jgi:hypothetical protein
MTHPIIESIRKAFLGEKSNQDREFLLNDIRKELEYLYGEIEK